MTRSNDLARLVVLQNGGIVHKFDPESRDAAEQRKRKEEELEHCAREEAEFDGNTSFVPATYVVWSL